MVEVQMLVGGMIFSLHYLQALANVTMATIAIGKIGKLVLPRTSRFIIICHKRHLLIYWDRIEAFNLFIIMGQNGDLY
jgi:membrane protein CcdC involved in cytochrome C biogenesis